MSRKALLFGSNGFMGGYLAAELAAHDYIVIGSDRGAASSAHACRAYYACDLLDGEAVARIVADADPDVIVNLAAISSVGLSWRAPKDTVEVNVVGTLNVLDAACALPRSTRVLLIGSSEEYTPSNDPLSEDAPTDATNPYGISKIAQERFAQLYALRDGLEIVMTRSFNHTGPGQAPTFVIPSWCDQIAQIEAAGGPGELVVGNLDVRRDFSDVRDIAAAYRLLIERGRSGEVYNVGSGRACSLHDILDVLVSHAKQPIDVRVDPALCRPTDTSVICCDGRKMEEAIGWRPQKTLEQTLLDTLESFREKRGA